jgi:hypothetical protein
VTVLLRAAVNDLGDDGGIVTVQYQAEAPAVTRSDADFGWIAPTRREISRSGSSRSEHGAVATEPIRLHGEGVADVGGGRLKTAPRSMSVSLEIHAARRIRQDLERDTVNVLCSCGERLAAPVDCGDHVEENNGAVDLVLVVARRTRRRSRLCGLGVGAIGRWLSGLDSIDLLDQRAEPTAFGGAQGIGEHCLRPAGLVGASFPIELRPSEL